MQRPRIMAAVLTIATAVTAAPMASADPANDLKQQGLKAARDKNWALARERFEQSYALDPRPLTLFNLAVAQEYTGRLVDARDSYTAFLARPASRDTERFRKLARDALAKLDTAIPTLQIRVTGLATGDAVELDGVARSVAAPIAVDPGSHTVAVRRGREAIAERTIALVRGQHADIELVAPIPVPVPRVDRAAAPGEPAAAIRYERTPPGASASILRSGWFWGVTAVVVLAAAGAGYYYVEARPGDPTPGTLGPGVLSIP